MPAPVPVAAPPDVRRPKGSPFAVRFGSAIDEGTKLYVESNDAFYGLRFGACTATFEKGAHVVAEELDDGWFVSKNGYEFPVEESIGVLEDNHGNRAKLGIKGVVRLRIDEPGDFAAAMGTTGAVDLEQMSAKVRSKVREMVEGEVRDLLAKDRYFTSLRSKKATDEIAKEVRAKWAGDPECDPFTSIELVKLDLPSEAIAKEEPPPEPEPAIEFQPPPPGPEVAPGPPMHPAPPPEPAGPSIPKEGARVQVDWGNGQSYPGAVVSAGCLVRFENGQEQWISLDRIKVVDS